MPDDPDQEHAVRYWTHQLGVSRDQLEDALRVVDPSRDGMRAPRAPR